MRRHFGIIRDLSGNALVNATITVRIHETLANATLFADPFGVTPLSNPLESDSRGEYRFCAQDGLYDIIVQHMLIGSVIYDRVQLSDLSPFEFDVRSFGAVGDGLVDDTTAIQAALDAAVAAGDGSQVLFHPGLVYRVMDTLSVRGSIALLLEGATIDATGMDGGIVVMFEPATPLGSHQSLSSDLVEGSTGVRLPTAGAFSPGDQVLVWSQTVFPHAWYKYVYSPPLSYYTATCGQSFLVEDTAAEGREVIYRLSEPVAESMRVSDGALKVAKVNSISPRVRGGKFLVRSIANYSSTCCLYFSYCRRPCVEGAEFSGYSHAGADCIRLAHCYAPLVANVLCFGCVREDVAENSHGAGGIRVVGATSLASVRGAQGIGLSHLVDSSDEEDPDYGAGSYGRINGVFWTEVLDCKNTYPHSIGYRFHATGKYLEVRNCTHVGWTGGFESSIQSTRFFNCRAFGCEKDESQTPRYVSLTYAFLIADNTYQMNPRKDMVIEDCYATNYLRGFLRVKQSSDCTVIGCRYVHPVNAPANTSIDYVQLDAMVPQAWAGTYTYIRDRWVSDEDEYGVLMVWAATDEPGNTNKRPKDNYTGTNPYWVKVDGTAEGHPIRARGELIFKNCEFIHGSREITARPSLGSFRLVEVTPNVADTPAHVWYERVEINSCTIGPTVLYGNGKACISVHALEVIIRNVISGDGHYLNDGSYNWGAQEYGIIVQGPGYNGGPPVYYPGPITPVQVSTIVMVSSSYLRCAPGNAVVLQGATGLQNTFDHPFGVLKSSGSPGQEVIEVYDAYGDQIGTLALDTT